eukprot:966997-Pyramimonas_sp.AAC.1
MATARAARKSETAARAARTERLEEYMKKPTGRHQLAVSWLCRLRHACLRRYTNACLVGTVHALG